MQAAHPRPLRPRPLAACCTRTARGAAGPTWGDFVAAWKETRRGLAADGGGGLAVIARRPLLADAGPAGRRLGRALPGGALGGARAGRGRRDATRACAGPPAGASARSTDLARARRGARPRRRPLPHRERCGRRRRGLRGGAAGRGRRGGWAASTRRERARRSPERRPTTGCGWQSGRIGAFAAAVAAELGGSRRRASTPAVLPAEVAAARRGGRRGPGGRGRRRRGRRRSAPAAGRSTPWCARSTSGWAARCGSSRVPPGAAGAWDGADLAALAADLGARQGGHGGGARRQPRATTRRPSWGWPGCWRRCRAW